MKSLFTGLVLGLAFTVLSTHARAQQRVGQIYIIGNEITKQDVILRAVPFFPGQVLHYPDVCKAEKNLETLGIFDVDRSKGIRPRVTVLDPNAESPFKDVLVTIKETTTSRLRWMAGLSASAEPVLSLVWEERNFDPLRWPTCLEDLTTGRAFRGAGQLFRLELVQIPLLPYRLPHVLRLGSVLIPVDAASRSR